MPCKSIVTIFLLQSGNILFVDPFLRVAAGAANIAVDKHSGEIAPSGLNVITDTICSGLARNFDDVRTIALGTNLSVLHRRTSQNSIEPDASNLITKQLVAKSGIIIQCVPSGEKLHFCTLFAVQRPLAVLMAHEIVQAIV